MTVETEVVAEVANGAVAMASIQSVVMMKECQTHGLLY